MEELTTAVVVYKALSAAGPAVKEFTVRVAGLVGDQVGGFIADQVGYLRWRSGVKMLGRAERFASAQGVPIRAIPLKNFVPLLEGASLEEESDDDMIDRWAHLLVSNMTPGTTPPGWADILRQLSPAEARALDWIYDATVLMPVDVWDINGARTPTLASYLGLAQGETGLICDTLGRLGLLQTPGVNSRRPNFAVAVSLTRLGYWFVNACREPEKAIFPPEVASAELLGQLEQQCHPTLTPGGVYPGGNDRTASMSRVAFGVGPQIVVSAVPPPTASTTRLLDTRQAGGRLRLLRRASDGPSG
jgi:hypothetical protein